MFSARAHVERRGVHCAVRRMVGTGGNSRQAPCAELPSPSCLSLKSDVMSPVAACHRVVGAGAFSEKAKWFLLAG